MALFQGGEWQEKREAFLIKEKERAEKNKNLTDKTMLKLGKKALEAIGRVSSEINKYYDEIDALEELKTCMKERVHTAGLYPGFSDNGASYLFDLESSDLDLLIKRRSEEINKCKICLMDPYGISYAEDNYIKYK